MPILEDRRDSLDAHATTGSTLLPKGAVSLALLLAQYSAYPIAMDANYLQSLRTHPTLSRVLSSDISYMDVFKQINRVYDDLLLNQVELDHDSKHLLYANLWDLYT